MVGGNNVRAQGVRGYGKVRRPGVVGMGLGMASHQMQESHINKGDGTSNVQSRRPR